MYYYWLVKRLEYNKAKDEWLREYRGISFKDLIGSIKNNKVLAIEPHPNKKRYPHQKIFIIEYDHYIYSVPFVEDEEKIFLKTIYASRKLTKKYLKGGKNEEKAI